jgi:hypothetical protein
MMIASARYWLAGAVGALGAVTTLSGCPGTLDPQVAALASESGGSSGSSTGGNGSGGATGSGGSTVDCTGNNDGATIVTMNCATSDCHIPGAANDGTAGGLDLTVDANIGARLVNVTSVGTASNGSKCAGNTEPYLKGGVTPAMGLLIDKVQMAHPPCGAQMPYAAPFPLTATQQTCLIQWATTLTSP